MRASNSYDFERLYVNYSPRMIAYATRFVANRAEAQDIVHDCFTHLWNRKTFLSEEESAALLFVILRNRCIDYLRHKSVTNKHIVDTLRRERGAERLYNHDFSYDNTEHPYLYMELEQQMQKILNILPDRCREIFVMSRMEGLKNREIAEKLQISTQAVEKHISKAVRIFSERFAKSYSIYQVLFSILFLDS